MTVKKLKQRHQSVGVASNGNSQSFSLARHRSRLTIVPLRRGGLGRLSHSSLCILPAGRTACTPIPSRSRIDDLSEMQRPLRCNRALRFCLGPRAEITRGRLTRSSDGGVVGVDSALFLFAEQDADPVSNAGGEGLAAVAASMRMRQ